MNELTLNATDLTVLSWYAAWTPEVHRADWLKRRRLPPGYRFMTDCSCYGNEHKAQENMSYPPACGGEDPNQGGRRSAALGYLHRLLAHRLLEGAYGSACRLTPRGRAALKFHQKPCPDFFESHCPDIFDDHSLLPVQGKSFRLSRDMRRPPEGYRLDYGQPVPDNPQTWSLMLQNFMDDDNQGLYTSTGAQIRLSEQSGGARYLSGSLRKHYRVVGIEITDEHHRAICEVHLSKEQLASMLVGNGNVSCTLAAYYDTEGVRQSKPAPPPLSVGERVKHRVREGSGDIQDAIQDIISKVDEAALGKKFKTDLLNRLHHLSRSVDGHGSFVTEQAMEELSSVVESLTVIHAEQHGALFETPQLVLPGGTDGPGDS